MGTGIPPSPSTDAVVSELRARLQERRPAIEAMHRDGAPAAQVCAALAAFGDDVIQTAYGRAIEAASPADAAAILRSLALVAVGGFGRGELAPYSDIDLLFLVAPGAPKPVGEFISQLVRVLWDVGLKLSQSVRTPAEAVQFARKDFPARTALFEARLVTGSQPLFADFRRRVHRLVATFPIDRLIREALASRTAEHKDYYPETVYLLEPNVKKSPGGLRDVHFLRWVALARYGTSDPEMLRVSGILGPADADVLARVSELLRRIRNELHFAARAAQDVLTREEQVRLAEWLGYHAEGALLGVERFMQQYYRQTADLHDLVLRFADRVREASLWRRWRNRLLTHRADEHVLVGRDRIDIDRHAGPETLRRVDICLHLFDLARRHGVPVGDDTLERVREAVPSAEVTVEARRRFLQCLGEPRGLGSLLRNLHRVGLLERLIPAFSHVRCLIQFSLLHHYTIDEHSIRAVEAATRWLDEPGPLGRVYREIRRKDLLHLVLLLHDLGKGYGEDHSEVGRRIAEEAAGQFELDARERTLLVELVHQHLLMAHTALRRDPTDPKTILGFARRVGTPEALRMLYVVTAADTDAVAPGEWSAWKEELVGNLYERTMEELTGEAPAGDERARTDAARHAVASRLRNRFSQEWLESQLDAMPPAYLLTTEPQQVAEHLDAIQALPRGGLRVLGRFLAETGLTQYTVLTWDDVTPGLFSKIAGVLTSVGFQIVDAQIVTRSDGVVIDTFRGLDTDFSGPPPSGRHDEVAKHIGAVLFGQQTVEALLSRRGGTPSRDGPTAFAESPHVAIDNESSDRFTIVEVFAEDRLGLLHAITRTLYDQGLSVGSARVSTHYEQIVDVFYVTARDGRKVTDAERLEAVRQAVLAVV